MSTTQIVKRIAIDNQNINQIGNILGTLRTGIPEMTQGIVADAMGVAQAHISSMESNKKIPTLPSIINYLEVVGYRVVIEKI